MTESSEPNKNESVADVLARMQTELNFQMPEDGPQLPVQSEQNTTPQQPSAPTPVAMAAPAPPAPEAISRTETGQNQEEDMDQMTEYMGSLLQRYGGSGEQTAAPVQMKQEKKELHDEMKIGETCEVPNLLSAGEYIPEKIAPEKKDNIAVMRELAVHSARKAIQVSVKKKRQSDAALRKILAGVTAVLGIGALVLSGLEFNFLSILGTTSLGASGYFCYLIKKFDIDGPLK